MNDYPGECRRNQVHRAKSVHAIRSLNCCLVFLAWVSLLAATGRTQPAVPAEQPKKGTNAVLANRWLVIVETSKRMRSRAQGVEDSIPALVFSGMNGQMWRGDTLGVWTFNEELHSGQFPLQEWTPGNSQSIALDVADFLKRQKYENDGYLEKVFPYIQRIIKSSEYITVLLVSDGRKKIEGTPFDNKINSFYQTWEKQQDKAHLPFITVLRAEHGQITNYAVTIPPYPLDLPPLPHELAARMVEPAPALVAAPRVVPPLIVHGKPPEPTPAAAPAEPIATNSAPAASAETNETPIREAVSAASPATTASETSDSELPQPAAAAAGEKSTATPPMTAAATNEAPAPAMTNPEPAAAVLATTTSNPAPQPGEMAPPAKPVSLAESTETASDRFWNH